MTAQRSTKEEHLYRKKRTDDKGREDCDFCAMTEGHPQHVRETAHLRVIRNRTPYSLWDDQRVLDHLMVIPTRHTAKLGDFDSNEARELISLIDEYEEQGYCLYARALHSKVRSVVHQHTHLMKLDGKKRNFLLMARKPWYFRISK